MLTRLGGGPGRISWYTGKGRRLVLVRYTASTELNRKLIMTSLALHYPYVLAFEPTFVEIRHCETGLMSQVIQGNNLRLIFADTPPSTTNTASPMYYSPPGYNMYTSSATTYGGRSSMQSGYGPPPPPPPHMGYPNMYPRPNAQPFGRDEILMVSDDRVLTLRLATEVAQAQPLMSDVASSMSIPPR